MTCLYPFISDTSTANVFQLHNLPENESVCLIVENFDVVITRNESGGTVRLFDVDEDAREPAFSLAEAHAYNRDTRSYKEKGE